MNAPVKNLAVIEISDDGGELGSYPAPDSSKPALLPCPFCGCGELELVKERHGIVDLGFTYQCIDCAIRGPWRRTKNAAAELWNTRAQAKLPMRSAEAQQAIEDVEGFIFSENFDPNDKYYIGRWKEVRAYIAKLEAKPYFLTEVTQKEARS